MCLIHMDICPTHPRWSLCFFSSWTRKTADCTANPKTPVRYFRRHLNQDPSNICNSSLSSLLLPARPHPVPPPPDSFVQFRVHSPLKKKKSIGILIVKIKLIVVFNFPRRNRGIEGRLVFKDALEICVVCLQTFFFPLQNSQSWVSNAFMGEKRSFISVLSFALLHFILAHRQKRKRKKNYH